MPMLLAPNNARAASFQWVLRTSYPLSPDSGTSTKLLHVGPFFRFTIRLSVVEFDLPPKEE
jgi:hypothetical protein